MAFIPQGTLPVCLCVQCLILSSGDVVQWATLMVHQTTVPAEDTLAQCLAIDLTSAFLFQTRRNLQFRLNSKFLIWNALPDWMGACRHSSVVPGLLFSKPFERLTRPASAHIHLTTPLPSNSSILNTTGIDVVPVTAFSNVGLQTAWIVDLQLRHRLLWLQIRSLAATTLCCASRMRSKFKSSLSWRHSRVTSRACCI